MRENGEIDADQQGLSSPFSPIAAPANWRGQIRNGSG